MPTLSSAAKESIQSALDSATSQNGGVAGLVFCAIDKSGSFLTKQCSGSHGHAAAAKKSPMTTDSVFWIASCTKMITGIACMQLVEQGKLDLDSAQQVYQVCPEIKVKKVLKEDGTLEERKGDITTRMLLSHTAGFGYTFFNEKLRDYGRPAGYDEFAGDPEDYLEMPLVNQPGSKWEYGVNIDWAGIMVERISGMKLDAYFKKHIFEPLGIENISFVPSDHMRENMVTMARRSKDGTTVDSDHGFRRPIYLAGREKDRLLHAGGAGCFAKPAEYCQIIAMLLNDGVSPSTSKRILEAKTVNKMFTNQIPEFPDFGRVHIADAKPEWTNALPQLYPQEGDPAQGWGLTFMLTHEAGVTGRGKNTGWWAGITNLFWWADRERGIGGMIAAQILPFGDGQVMGAWFASEKAVYDGLEGQIKANQKQQSTKNLARI